MTFFTAFGHSILVLNSVRVVDDLLSKRGDQYSHRPRFVMGGELVGLNKVMSSSIARRQCQMNRT